MGLLRNAIVVGLCISFAFIYPMPIPFNDRDVQHYENKNNLADGSNCSCGFYESNEEIEDDIVPLVASHAISIPCSLNGLLLCYTVCENATDSLMNKLCQEKEHWITKPGNIVYKFCASSQWINTGIKIHQEDLVCCHNGLPIDCSIMESHDDIKPHCPLNESEPLGEKEITETEVPSFITYGFPVDEEENIAAFTSDGFTVVDSLFVPSPVYYHKPQKRNLQLSLDGIKALLSHLTSIEGNSEAGLESQDLIEVDLEEVAFEDGTGSQTEFMPYLKQSDISDAINFDDHSTDVLDTTETSPELATIDSETSTNPSPCSNQCQCGEETGKCTPRP